MANANKLGVDALVVEQDDVERRITAHLLIDEQLKVQTVPTIAEAMTWLGGAPVRMVLLGDVADAHAVPQLVERLQATNRERVLIYSIAPHDGIEPALQPGASSGAVEVRDAGPEIHKVLDDYVIAIRES